MAWLSSPLMGWIALALRGLVGLFFVWLAYKGLSGDPQTVADYQRWGYPDWFRTLIALGQAAGGLAFLVPQTSMWAGGLLMVILVGAFATHAWHDAPATLISPALFALAVVVALAPHWVERLG
jgi:hypothetical protein